MCCVRSSGLVLSPKSDREPGEASVQIEIYEDIVEIHVASAPLPGDEIRAGHGPGNRRKITEFSSSSRNNMLRKMARIRSLDDALFVTLTYPDEFPDDPAEWKRHLSVLRKRMMRRFPYAGVVWRMEKKPRLSGKNRGAIAPHFHLLVVGWPGSHLIARAWFRAAWYAIAHNGDKHLGLAAVQVDPIKSRRHACYYVSKYMGKANQIERVNEVEGAIYTGRYWGTFGNLDMAVILVIAASLDALVALKRLFRGWTKHRNRAVARRLSRYGKSQGVSIFGLGGNMRDGPSAVWDAPIFRMIMATVEE